MNQKQIMLTILLIIISISLGAIVFSLSKKYIKTAEIFVVDEGEVYSSPSPSPTPTPEVTGSCLSCAGTATWRFINTTGNKYDCKVKGKEPHYSGYDPGPCCGAKSEGSCILEAGSNCEVTLIDCQSPGLTGNCTRI